jgi:hypothetical protein
MPTYDFECPKGHVVEVHCRMDERDIARPCPEHKCAMWRKLTVPLGVQWAGHFENRHAKVADGDW